MRVASANVQHGVPDRTGRPALHRAIEALRQLRADVWGFQELDHRRWRTWFADQGEQLADAIGGELVWAPAKRVFVGGFAMFILASAACGLAPSLGVLIAARAAQGIGAAVLIPCSLTLLTHSHPGAERARAVARRPRRSRG